MIPELDQRSNLSLSAQIGRPSMNAPCTLCNVCDHPASLEASTESAQIASNVRRFRQRCFTVWRCGYCRSLHCKEAVDLDNYYAHYPLQHQELKYLTRQAYKQRVRLLQRAGLQTTDQVLDYGCGEGLLLNLLQRQGFRQVVGYDPYVPRYADEAALNSQYDTVVSFGVIEHVPHPRDFLNNVKKCIRPGGRAVIATPEAGGLDLQEPDELLFHQPYHLHILSELALRESAASCGLRVVDTYHRNWMDTLHPAVNSRFVTSYIRRAGALDALFEPVRAGMVAASPSLFFWMCFGYFFPRPGYIVATLTHA